jgi:hypothetical protein
MTSATPQGKKEGLVVDTGAATLLGWAVFEFICWVALGLVAITVLWWMHTPWPRAASFLVSSESPLPFVGWFAGLPIVGGGFSAIMSSPVRWVSIVLMVAVNTIQVLAILHEAGYIKLQGKWVEALSFFAIGSWLIELWVGLLDNSIFLGGWQGFVSDLPVPTLSSFDMAAIFQVSLLMFAFEVTITICAICILALRHNQLKSKAKAKAKAAGAS